MVDNSRNAGRGRQVIYLFEMKPKKIILVVDDEGSVRELLQEVLSNFGYQVLPASSGSEAIAIWESRAAPIDLLLTDIRMNAMNGIELAAALAALQPGLKVLYMSGGTEEEIEKLIHIPPTTGFVAKPFRLAALQETIRASLEI